MMVAVVDIDVAPDPLELMDADQHEMDSANEGEVDTDAGTSCKMVDVMENGRSLHHPGDACSAVQQLPLP